MWSIGLIYVTTKFIAIIEETFCYLSLIIFKNLVYTVKLTAYNLKKSSSQTGLSSEYLLNCLYKMIISRDIATRCSVTFGAGLITVAAMGIIPALNRNSRATFISLNDVLQVDRLIESNGRFSLNPNHF